MTKRDRVKKVTEAIIGAEYHAHKIIEAAKQSGSAGVSDYLNTLPLRMMRAALFHRVIDDFIYRR